MFWIIIFLDAFFSYCSKQPVASIHYENQLADLWNLHELWNKSHWSELFILVLSTAQYSWILYFIGTLINNFIICQWPAYMNMSQKPISM